VPWALTLMAAAGPLAAVSLVWAHALLVDSTPKNGEIVTSPPRVVLRFNSRIERGLSSVRLTGGPRKTTILLMSSASDPHLDVLVFALGLLEPGAWEAQWRVLSVDGHVTEGVVKFTVVPGPGGETRQ
jgi:hypothetical protein